MEFTEVNELSNFVKCSKNPTTQTRLGAVPISLKYFSEEPIHRIFAYSPIYRKNGLEPGSKEMSGGDYYTPLSNSLGAESQIKHARVCKEQTQRFEPQHPAVFSEVHPREETIGEFAFRLVLDMVNNICGNPVERVSLFPRALPRGSLGYSTITKMMTKTSDARSIARSYLYKPVRRKGPNTASIEIFLMETGKAIYLNVQKHDNIEQIIKQILYVCKEHKVYNGEIFFPFESPD